MRLESHKGRQGKCRAGQEGETSSRLLIDSVSALPALRFERLDGESSLLHRAGHEAADGVPLPAHFGHDLGQSGSVLALEHGHHLGCLTTLARCTGDLRLGGPFALGRVLGVGGLSWLPCPPWARPWPTVIAVRVPSLALSSHRAGALASI